MFEHCQENILHYQLSDTLCLVHKQRSSSSPSSPVWADVQVDTGQSNLGYSSPHGLRFSRSSQVYHPQVLKGLPLQSSDPGAHFTNDFSITIQIRWKFSSNSITFDYIATKFGTWHDSPADVPCAKFCSDHFISTWMRARWNFHHIWIVMEKLLVKWAPEQFIFPDASVGPDRLGGIKSSPRQHNFAESVINSGMQHIRATSIYVYITNWKLFLVIDSEMASLSSLSYHHIMEYMVFLFNSRKQVNTIKFTSCPSWRTCG